MSKEAIKNLLMDFMADYDPNKWSNDDVYEKYAEKIDKVRSMGEIIAFTELTKKFKDLEAKLAEKTRVAEGYSELFDKKQHENYEQFCEIQELKKQLEYIAKNKYEERLLAYERKVNQLKQQLAEKDAEVQSWKDGTMVVKLGRLEEQLAEKEKEIEEYQKLINDTCNRFMVCSLNEITQNQTAIAVMEKVKEWLEPKYFDKEQINYLANVIDQQIAELKGEK